MLPKRLLIAGASGFVGQALLRDIAGRAGSEAIAGLREPAGTPLAASVAAIDVTQPEALKQALAEAKPDVMINAAAYGVQPGQVDPELAERINVAGAANLLEAAAAAGCPRFVQLGSCSEYGAGEGLVGEDTPAAPNTLYGKTKAAATTLVLERGAALGVDVVVFRLFNIWGEGEASHRLFPAVLAACRAKQPLELTECTQVKNYSYIGDLADWIVSLAVRPQAYGGRIVNLGSDESRPLRDFVLDIAGPLGGAELMRFGAKPRRAEEALTQLPDLTRLHALLPGRRVTPLAAALARVLEEWPAETRAFT